MRTGGQSDARATSGGAGGVATVTAEEMRSAVAGTARDFLALLRSVPPEASGNRVPGLDWTAAEVAAHVIGLMRPDRRWRTLDELSQVNESSVAEVGAQDPGTLADLFQDALVAASGRENSDDTEFPFGLVANRLEALSYFLCDLLVHGFDIARATGLPWTVAPGPAAVGVRTALPTMSLWVRPEVLAGPVRRLVLGFGDGGAPLLVEVGADRYRASPGAPDGVPRTDADAAAVLLALARQQPSGDALVEMFASWYLPI